MSRNSVNERPSTPPSSLPTSPTNFRDVALRTPLKISRSRHQSFAPFTPQSLRTSRPPPTSKDSHYQAAITTPTRKLPSTQTSNWRVHEDTLSSDSGSQEHKTPDTQPLGESATPTKHLGPFTPQVIKRARDPLRLEISNFAITEDLQVRGSLTDPPPRRRMGRPMLSDENSPELAIIKPLDINVPIPRTETKTEARSYPRFPDACASCGSRERLSLLQPCQHHICASCVAGSLNVVGEKSMICMYCHSPIHSFQISDRIHPGTVTRRTFTPASQYNHSSNNAFNPSAPRPNRPNRPRASPGSSSPVIPAGPSPDNAVLRIANIPWDVTPNMLEQWLGGPIVQCHVLLDRADGRTLNHAYVETSADAARASLTSHQNKTLGHGRRSRPLFPSWNGKFKGTTPIYQASLAGSKEPLSPEFLTASELSTMLHLIQRPQSHFLKVPCLAYWSLLSTLVKFPAPDVFAPGMAPDMLFNITTYALEKYETLVGSRGYDCVLHTKLIAGAIHCRAFTDRQLHLLLHFTNRPLPVAQENLAPNLNSLVTPQGFRHQPQLPFSPNLIQRSWHEGAVQLPMGPGLYAAIDPCDRVAQDFGVDPSLVHALAGHLTSHSSTAVAPLGWF